MRRQLHTAQTVPTTSIYSSTDGVVAWQACLRGLGWNARVLQVVADRLSQPRGRWRPFKPSGHGVNTNAACRFI
jgi:hypothetical protein